MNHFAIVCRNGAPTNRSGYRGRERSTIRQLSLDETNSGHKSQGPESVNGPLEDDDDEVFTISFIGKENQRKRPPPKCTINIGQTEVIALIDTGASLNVIGTTQFNKLSPCPHLTPT